MEPNFYFELEPSIWSKEHFDNLMIWADNNNFSDIVIQSDNPIWGRKNGNWLKVTKKRLNTNVVAELLDEVTNNKAAFSTVISGKPIDFLYELKSDRFTKKRFRGNATSVKSRSALGLSVVFRTISGTPPKLEELNIEPELFEHLFPEKGLSLVTGVMGSGKSTLLASILREIIETKNKMIQTYESPIEFDLVSIKDSKSLVCQTSIPEQLDSFSEAARNSTRRAADIILIGESRDRETLKSMLEASEIGVSAYSTVHTRTVSDTPARIINTFPSEEQLQMSTTLFSALRFIIQQRLVPKVGGGRIALREFLVFNEDIREKLYGKKIGEISPILKNLVEQKGQSLLSDASKKYKEGLIFKETLTVLENEFLKK